MKELFRSLVIQHESHVYSAAVHILRDRAEAEDVTQEVFIRLWDNIGEIEVETAKAWLTVVTKNICIDHLRARKSDEMLSSNLECPDGKKEPVAALLQSHLSQWLKRTIASLKEPYRRLIILRELEQRSYKEIAELEMISITQVKVYLHRARQQLKQQLQKVEL